MRGLDESFAQKAVQFQQIVPIFTNVVYDTSQVHANTVFPQMFAWLDLVHGLIQEHPETLFVIRAHPDEMRAGKQSRESVPDWVEKNQVDRLSNVIFVGPTEYLSSYELIQRSKFVMVYNSSIGLEAALMGKAVLCGGKARYTPTQSFTFLILPKPTQGWPSNSWNRLVVSMFHRNSSGTHADLLTTSFSGLPYHSMSTWSSAQKPVMYS
jgi:hypothetical protein